MALLKNILYLKDSYKRHNKTLPLLSYAGLVACGGQEESHKPKIVETSPGFYSIEKWDAILFKEENVIKIVSIKPEKNEDYNMPRSLSNYAEEITFEDTTPSEIYVFDGSRIFIEIKDYIETITKKEINIIGDVWLIVDKDSFSGETGVLLQNTKNSHFTLAPTSSGANFNFPTNSTIFIEGTLALKNITLDLSNISNWNLNTIKIQDNSKLVIEYSQLSKISNFVHDEKNSTIQIKIESPEEVSYIIQDLYGGKFHANMILEIEPTTLEAFTALIETMAEQVILLPEAPKVKAISGSNDTPIEVLLDVYGLRESTQDQVVGKLFAVDIDLDDTHKFTISDDRFYIEDDFIKLSQNVEIDFEEEPQISFVITATDSGNASVNQEFFINIEDVNEPPLYLNLEPTGEVFYSGISYDSDVIIAKVHVDDDALGSNTIIINPGAYSDLFYANEAGIFLRSGVEIPNVSEIYVSVSAFDPKLIDALPIQNDITLFFSQTNSFLNPSPIAPSVHRDLDASSTYSPGDIITISFSQAVDMSSISLSDFRLTAGDWGNALILSDANAQHTTSIMIELGTSTLLPLSPSFIIERGSIFDEAGLTNSGSLIFDLPSAAGTFDITFTSAIASKHITAFEAAANAWEEIIIADLPDVSNVDDVDIEILFSPIDGYGGIIAEALITGLRVDDTGLPFLGEIRVDTADFDSFSSSEKSQIIFHEIAHVLGFGTLWQQKDLVLYGKYIGTNALREYQNAGGTLDYIPLENTGGPGSVGVHWSEEIFREEIMTSAYDSPSNVSLLTIAAMDDLGYAVNYDYLTNSFV